MFNDFSEPVKLAVAFSPTETVDIVIVIGVKWLRAVVVGQWLLCRILLRASTKVDPECECEV